MLARAGQRPGDRVTEQAWHLLLQRHRLREVPDHSYAEAMRWAPNSRAFLMSLRGHGASGVVTDWLCVFDVQKLRVSLDLGIMNRGSVEVRRPGMGTPP